MAKLNFMEVHICQRKHVHDIIVNRKHSSYFPYFFIPFLFVYKNLYIISSSIKKFFMSTKTFILSKTETKLHFPQNSFLRTLIKKVVSLSFSFSKLKIVQKVQNSFSTVKLFKKFKRFKGCKGCKGWKLFSLSFLFSFPFLWKCIYVQNFSFSLLFLFLFSILVKVYLHS